MHLRSFGCSFTYGTDLPDCNQTWPALISKQLDLDYSCHAWPGSGNLRILENIINHIDDSEPSIFVINWTWIDRFDYTTTDDAWQTILPSDTAPLSTSYYKNLHSQYRDKLTTLLHIDSAINLLSQTKIPFVMTCIDDLIFETKWHTSNTVLKLQERVQPYLLNFNGQNFLDWANSNNYPVSKTLHPLTQAHASAADLMLDQVKKCLT